MKVIYTATARRHIANQLGYLVDQGARRPAERLRNRIAAFVKDVIAAHPRTGRHIAELDIYESWIPRTPFVVFYRFDSAADTITVLALFHVRQDRSGFHP